MKSKKNNYNLHLIQKGGWFYEFGLEYNFKKSIAIFTNLRIQSVYNLAIDSDNVTSIEQSSKTYKLILENKIN